MKRPPPKPKPQEEEKPKPRPQFDGGWDQGDLGPFPGFPTFG